LEALHQSVDMIYHTRKTIGHLRDKDALNTYCGKQINNLKPWESARLPLTDHIYAPLGVKHQIIFGTSTSNGVHGGNTGTWMQGCPECCDALLASLSQLD